MRDSEARAAAASGQQIAALREEIRRAGWRIYRGRFALALSGGLVFILMMATSVVLTYRHGPSFQNSPADQLFGAVACSAWIGCFVVGPVGYAFVRWGQAQQFRRRLRTLSPSERADLLAPLQNDPSDDIRKIAASLARDIQGDTELAPAAPEARGGEASPAEPKCVSGGIERWGNGMMGGERP
jgi:hypothetical protein